MEGQSPFRFLFLDRTRKLMQGQSRKFIQLFEAFLAGEEDEPAFPWLPTSLMPR